ncbi:MAG: replicative DNA helicase [Clostridia bacterium]|nr:replicative DNA helicase [Clostridia bacterium]
MIEKIPPHSEEAEKAVLGAAMLDKDALLMALEKVRAEYFYQEAHKEIFEAIYDLYRENKPVDMLTVCEKLTARNTLEMVGGRPYIAALCMDIPSVSNASEYAKIVTEKSTTRNLIKASEEINSLCFSGEMKVENLLDYAEQSIFDIAKQKQSREYVPISEVMLENLKAIDEAAQNPGRIHGVPTGFKDLDNKLGGLKKSDLIIIAARPSMGKTAFALNIAQQSAIKHGSSVLIFSLEMDRTQLGQRMLSVESRVEIKKLQDGDLQRKDWERISASVDTLSKANIQIDNTPGISFMEIKNKCRRLKAEKGLDLVVIDYLQLMSYEGKTESRLQEVSALSRNLKLLAREMECPVIVLSQLSRAVEKRDDKRPILSDLRESGSIEQDADIVMFLHREDYYDKDNEDKKGICEVNIAKNRNGETGRVELTWVERYTKFSDRSKETI